MAECHPVGFQWVMEAKERGAKVIHVDPRFSRTSAVADLHVPIRAGTDIAFLGGIVNYILENGREFREYVVHYTNAATIVNEDFRDTEDLDGLFSGFDSENATYDISTWSYEGAEVHAAAGNRDMAAQGEAHGRGSTSASGRPTETDPTLEHPRCVFQLLKKHYRRYTPELVEQVCGIPQDLFFEVAEALVENSGRERTSAFCYAVGWTQHTVGVQYIRTAAIIQLLLGNIGRPGGGILALRGHASIQGSTDVPTLYNILPGYIPMRHAHAKFGLQDFIQNTGDKNGYWGHMDAYLVSMLKAWWGANATSANEYCFDYLPDLWFVYQLGRRIREKLAGSLEPKDKPILELTWDYPTHGEHEEPSAEAVLKEISGWTIADGKAVSGYEELKPDGSTACGVWIYSGCYADEENLPARRKPHWEQETWVAPEWAWTWPMNRHIIYNRASADRDGKPWSERKKYVWWDDEKQEWTGYDVPDFKKTMRPDYEPSEGAKAEMALRGDEPFIMQADGKGWLYVPSGLTDGPLPTHYEPHESPFANPLYKQQANPVRQVFHRKENPYNPTHGEPGADVFPYVMTTYRLTEHHTAGGMSRTLPYLSELQPEMFCEVSPELAAECGLEHGGWATVVSARTAIEARVLVP